MRSLGLAAGLSVLLLVAGVCGQESARGHPRTGKLSVETFSNLPIHFIENRGIFPDPVAYYVQGADKTLFLTRQGVTIRLNGAAQRWAVKLDFVDANPDAGPRGEDRRKAVFSYFKGRERDWKTGLRTYAKVVYKRLWPGVDLVYRGTVNRLKYEFVVSPGADPGRIRLRYQGATAVKVLDSGGLSVTTPVGGFEDAPPEAWQEVDGARVPVEVAFTLARTVEAGDVESGFRVGDYDRTRPLVLDPALLVYCGFVGGSSYDWSDGIAVDAAGNAYVTGFAESTEQTFPVKAGPDLTHNGSYSDAFVAKVDASGSRLVYCGYIGGAGIDMGKCIAVDSGGCAYVAGSTASDEKTFPVQVGPDVTYNGPFYQGGDCFVAKVSASGTSLVYCGYVGGAADDYATGIAVDAGGNAYISGVTHSTQTTFPVKIGPDLTYNGWADAFVAKVAATGATLIYCGFIGGLQDDWASGIAVDGAGHAYVCGATSSTQSTFPVKIGPDLTHNGGADGFLAKVTATGASFVYSGFIGGLLDDWAVDLALDAGGNVHVAGQTSSPEATFPVTVGPDLTHNGGKDAFVAKVSASGPTFIYCGYLGGSADDTSSGIAVDHFGHALLVGDTASSEATFPVKSGPDSTHNGAQDAFVAKLGVTGKQLVYCGYIGGKGNDWSQDIAVDPGGNAYVTGCTDGYQATFPVTVGPDLTHNGSYDGFVAKVAEYDVLQGRGTPRPGGTVVLELLATEFPSFPYQVGTSMGTGSIPIDTRVLGLSPDNLLAVSANNSWPAIFSGYRGRISATGKANATIHIPSLPALIGTRLHSAFVTLDPGAASGIRSISNTFSFSIAK